jgi:hypothetical protein
MYRSAELTHLLRKLMGIVKQDTHAATSSLKDRTPIGGPVESPTARPKEKGVTAKQCYTSRATTARISGARWWTHGAISRVGA